MISLFTPGWGAYVSGNDCSVGVISVGILTGRCISYKTIAEMSCVPNPEYNIFNVVKPKDDVKPVGLSSIDTDGLTIESDGVCVDRFSFEQWCVAAMFLTWFCEIGIFILITLSYVPKILPSIPILERLLPFILEGLAGTATFLLFTVAIVYPAKFSSSYKDKFGLLTGTNGDDIAYLVPSYSYYLMIFCFIWHIVAVLYGIKMIIDSNRARS
uniref:MARVEL domain-containing protein n=1 Tax=Acrobeloides nanus TaxID=290746 RepID=A0A914CSY8_9BILA